MGMDLEEARELLRRSIREREDAEDAVKQARATIESAGWIIRGLVRRFPELADELDEAIDFSDSVGSFERPPPTAHAVRLVLQASPGEEFTVSELVTLLKNRGSLPVSDNPAAVIRTALERLINDSEADIYKGKLGTAVSYCYDPDRERPSAGGGYGYDEEPF
jgi:hypothetical protein